METKFISRSEEFILLAVWHLKANAYGVPIRERLRKTTGKTWAYGALFLTLCRLEKKGCLTSRFTGPTSLRGGKSKRIFELTDKGVEALQAVRLAQESVWTGVGKLAVPAERKR